VIFVAGVTLALGGIAEVMRCIVCIREGKWPSREGDVEELEVILLQEHGNKDAK
jgi:TRAP-type mannitol/chloroaromatic compound transport system permease small subunit